MMKLMIGDAWKRVRRRLEGKVLQLDVFGAASLLMSSITNLVAFDGHMPQLFYNSLVR